MAANCSAATVPRLRDALRVAAAKRSPREIALTQLRWAQVLREHGRTDLSVELAQAALRGFTDMGMSFYVEPTHRLCIAGIEH